MPFGIGKSKRVCEFCNEKKPTRKVEVDGEWKLICDSCWKEKRIVPYAMIL